MFRNAYQHGFLSILYSCGATPLAIWDKQVKNGYIKRITDDEVKSLVLEIAGTNVATTFISCPQDPKKVLGIKLPFLIMIIKNMKKYFTFEITILDDKDMHRRFRVSNFQSTTRVRPFCTTMPIGLSGGWNQVQFNLADFTRRAYGSNYVETTRMQIHANCRIRRIYYADRLYSEDEMPEEFKLFLPVRRKFIRESKSKPVQRSSLVKQVNAAGDQGERLPDEPPAFTAAVEESKEVEEKAEESPKHNSEFAPRKSSSVLKSESSRKSVGITIKDTVEDDAEKEQRNAVDDQERGLEEEEPAEAPEEEEAQPATEEMVEIAVTEGG
ncbi:cilia- and flagella-associated protein 20-like [Diprion similis]|uniref:cilia- and flagella-associated protein 20-like n=1 Tax=Diprion similis TaxID=362088 RepID=UPI001EF9AD7E|nr:cilia- and flagella-associated protein 20-like [Diprion similis]